MFTEALQIYLGQTERGYRPFYGCESLIELVTETADRSATEESPKLGIALVGQRGVGKYTVATAATEQLKTKGWEIAHHFAPDDPTGSLNYVLKVLREPSSTSAASPRSGSSALAIFIPEAEKLGSSGLKEIFEAQRQAMAAGQTTFLLLAGLPCLTKLIAAATPDSEKVLIMTVGSLAIEDVVAEFTAPLDEVGVKYVSAAIHRLAEDTGGYPFFVNRYAEALFQRTHPDGITLATVEHLIEKVRAINQGFYFARWYRADRAEHAVFTAMAEDFGKPSLLNTVTNRVSPNNPDAIHATIVALLDRGIIVSYSEETLEFSTPRFDEFVRTRSCEWDCNH